MVVWWTAYLQLRGDIDTRSRCGIDPTSNTGTSSILLPSELQGLQWHGQNHRLPLNVDIYSLESICMASLTVDWSRLTHPFQKRFKKIKDALCLFFCDFLDIVRSLTAIKRTMNDGVKKQPQEKEALDRNPTFNLAADKKKTYWSLIQQWGPGPKHCWGWITSVRWSRRKRCRVPRQTQYQ